MMEPFVKKAMGVILCPHCNQNNPVEQKEWDGEKPLYCWSCDMKIEVKANSNDNR